MQELLEQANEIQASLSRSYAVPDDISEDELEAGTFEYQLSHRMRIYNSTYRTSCS